MSDEARFFRSFDNERIVPADAAIEGAKAIAGLRSGCAFSRFLGTVSITRAYRARTSLAAGGMSDVMLLYGMSKTTPVAAPNVHPVSHRIGRHSRTTGTETVS